MVLPRLSPTYEINDSLVEGHRTSESQVAETIVTTQVEKGVL